MKITIGKGTIREREFEITQNELDEMLNHVHSKECNHKTKRFFIDIGANPNAVGISTYDVITMTPEQARIAVYNEFNQEKPNLDLITNILENSVIDINYQDISSKELFNYNLLGLASLRGLTEIVRMLLQRPEINVNVQDQDGFTALMWASDNGHTEIVRMLLERPDILVNVQNRYGYTALMRASGFGRTETFRMLLDHPQIDVNVQDEMGRTALIRASEEGHTEIVKLLLQRTDIDVNVQSVNGQSALKLTISSTNKMRVMSGVIESLLSDPRVDVEGIILNKELIKNSKTRKVIYKHPKIDVNKLHPSGDNLLISLARSIRWYNQDETIKLIGYLLKHPKIDVSIKNKEGKTAWDVSDTMIQKKFPQLEPSTQP